MRGGTGSAAHFQEAVAERARDIYLSIYLSIYIYTNTHIHGIDSTTAGISDPIKLLMGRVFVAFPASHGGRPGTTPHRWEILSFNRKDLKDF